MERKRIDENTLPCMIVDGIETPSLAKDILVMEEVKAWSAKKRG